MLCNRDAIATPNRILLTSRSNEWMQGLSGSVRALSAWFNPNAVSDLQYLLQSSITFKRSNCSIPSVNTHANAYFDVTRLVLLMIQMNTNTIHDKTPLAAG